jgi:hypothetical protein
MRKSPTQIFDAAILAIFTALAMVPVFTIATGGFFH